MNFYYYSIKQFILDYLPMFTFFKRKVFIMSMSYFLRRLREHRFAIGYDEANVI